MIIKRKDALNIQNTNTKDKEIANASKENKERESIAPSYSSQINSALNSKDDFESSNPEEDLDELKLNAQFLITSGCIDIDLEIFNIIHENGLVYNGRLIVQNNFQTTEPVIFACGRTCEFSFRYKNQAIGQALRLDKYNGRELGQKLAQNVLESLDLGYLTNYPIQNNEEELPKFYMAKGEYGVLPDNLKYIQIEK